MDIQCKYQNKYFLIWFTKKKSGLSRPLPLDLTHKDVNPLAALHLHVIRQLNELSVPLIAVLTLDLARIWDHPARAIAHRALIALALSNARPPAFWALATGEYAISDMLSSLIRDFFG